MLDVSNPGMLIANTKLVYDEVRDLLQHVCEIALVGGSKEYRQAFAIFLWQALIEEFGKERIAIHFGKHSLEDCDEALKTQAARTMAKTSNMMCLGRLTGDISPDGWESEANRISKDLLKTTRERFGITGDKKEKDFDIFSIYLCDCKKRPAEEK